jgi:sulfate permease, SulP family
VFERTRRGRAWDPLRAGLVIGAVETVLAVGFASMVFGGNLRHSNIGGYGLYLAGAAIALAVFAWTAGSRGVIGSLQGASAAALVTVTFKVALSTFGSPYRSFLTAVVATLVITVVTGLVLLLLGRFRLGHLIRFVPYPVIGGLLAGTGWLLLRAGVGVTVGQRLNISTLGEFGKSFQLERWIPAVAFGALMLVATRVVKRPMVIPVVLGAGLVLFVVGMLVTHSSIDEVRTGMWLVGPFDANRLVEPWTYRALARADWGALLEQSALIATAVLVAVIACLHDITGTELLLERGLDASREQRAAGVSNLVSAPFGAIPSHHSLPLTSLARSMQGGGAREVGLVAALVPAAAALFGGQVVGWIPRFLVAGMLVFLGLTFIVDWLVDARRRLQLGEYAVVVAILGAIAFRGYLSGMKVGLVASVILFAFNYSRVELVRQVEFGSTYRSNVDRPPAERQALRELADRVLILRVNGFVFFGMATGLVERIRKRVEAGSPRFLIVDLRRATGMDSSAVMAIRKVAGLAEATGFELVFTGGPKAVLAKLRHGGIEPSDWVVRFDPDLDHALQRAEDGLLHDEVRPGVAEPEADGFGGMPVRLMTYLERTEVAPGAVLLRQGDPSDDLYVLESGRLSVEMTTADGVRMRLRSVNPGVVVGEVAMYLGATRSADVLAETPSVVFRLSRDAIDRMEASEPDLAAQVHRWLAGTLADRLSDATRAYDALLE